MIPSDVQRLERLTRAISGEDPDKPSVCLCCGLPAEEANTFVEGAPVCRKCGDAVATFAMIYKKDLERRLVEVARPDKAKGGGR